MESQPKGRTRLEERSVRTTVHVSNSRFADVYQGKEKRTRSNTGFEEKKRFVRPLGECRHERLQRHVTIDKDLPFTLKNTMHNAGPSNLFPLSTSALAHGTSVS